MIFSNTYVGTDLDISGKILSENCMIDPIHSVKVLFNDNYFTAPVYTTSTLGLIKHFVFTVPFAAVSLVLMSPLRLLFSIVGTPEWETVAIPSPSASETEIRRYLRGHGVVNSLFFKFSLDKFSPLKLVLKGRIKLIGNTIKSGKNDGNSGVFSYSDSLNHEDPMEVEMDDLYYEHNRSMLSDIQLVFRSLISRLMKGGR